MKLAPPYRFKDIPKFTEFRGYSVDVSWTYLRKHIESEKAFFGGLFDMSPDFQRGHVWTMDKRVAYIEFTLRGGDSARNLYFNCHTYEDITSTHSPYVLVDGKQRLTSILMFLEDKIPVFGGARRSDFEDRMGRDYKVRWNVNSLKTRAEVLQWYLDLNTGGVVHTSEEIEKVQRLLEKERAG